MSHHDVLSSIIPKLRLFPQALHSVAAEGILGGLSRRFQSLGFLMAIRLQEQSPESCMCGALSRADLIC